MTTIRPAAVAGQFYPRDAVALRDAVAACLADAPAAPAGASRPKLIVVPHAGLVYSGPIAAAAYRRLAPWAAAIRRVVLLGPTHRVPVTGLAVPTVDAFESPLGAVAIDGALREAVLRLPQVVASDRAHAHEHAIEVQLPFLQAVLAPGFTLLPLAVGDASAGEVAAVLERAWGGDETLIVVSSDLSHYHGYEDACRLDRHAVRRILAGDTDLEPEEACGAHPLNGALRAVRQHGLHGELLDLRNSGDTAGDRRRVVGYAALAFAPPARPTSGDDEEAAAGDDDGLGPALLGRAHNAIAGALRLDLVPEPAHAALNAPGASFVSLHGRDGALRGCIGRLEATRRLEDDVRANAFAAAFEDPRFAPLARREWDGLQLEVSVLGAPRPLPAARDADEAAAALRPGIDGVILEWRGRRATFLPQVWAQLPEPADFLAALRHKAGLPAGFWSAELRLHRYDVRRFERPAAATA